MKGAKAMINENEDVTRRNKDIRETEEGCI